MGDIKDLVINLDDGAIDYIVLDFGGFPGLKDPYFAIPWDRCRLPRGKTRFPSMPPSVSCNTRRASIRSIGPISVIWRKLQSSMSFMVFPLPTRAGSTRRPRNALLAQPRIRTRAHLRLRIRHPTIPHC